MIAPFVALTVVLFALGILVAAAVVKPRGRYAAACGVVAMSTLYFLSCLCIIAPTR